MVGSTDVDVYRVLDGERVVQPEVGTATHTIYESSKDLDSVIPTHQLRTTLTAKIRTSTRMQSFLPPITPNFIPHSSALSEIQDRLDPSVRCPVDDKDWPSQSHILVSNVHAHLLFHQQVIINAR
ncbi:hypothetical protein EG68_02423 [Paragonimus skrjabini miyazakii]|uniref:Uncharacterized protein n=1 Tax=Paragonimus skrjabini miyazakii TaxID=59628 RepID=A0A8S9Z402_9TREM|nr:hypothetical protein EG68_02423 [Paragonimus skrjabini miyazakii]